MIPIDEGILSPAVAYTINAGPGDQFDPHVDGDIASYTSEATVRYYDFFSGQDVQVPRPADTVDYLSAVDAGRIVFAREDVLFGETTIVVYDTTNGVTTEIDMFSASAAPLRSQQQAGLITDRADIVSAGMLVTAPGGHGTEYGMKIPTFSKGDDPQKFIDDRIAEGSDFIKLVLEAAFQLSERGWVLLTRAWIGFFLFLAALNEAVWRNFSTDTWVSFKVFGVMPLTLLFSFAMIPVMMKHIIQPEDGNGSDPKGGQPAD